MTERPTVLPLGDAALLIRLPYGTDDYARAQTLAEAVAKAHPAGIRDAAAAYDTVALYFDPLTTSHEMVADFALRELASAVRAPTTAGEPHTIPVVYDGPDLKTVAERLKLSAEDVIELHTGVEYTAHAIGFVPGFAYLGELDERLRLPRRDSPRPRVPAGAVAIAGAHTAVYPFTTPGGWHLLGRTDLILFRPDRSPPALLTVGARVRFVPQ